MLRVAEGFDARAGVEWECGPDPDDVTDSIPDVPWNKYKRTLEPVNRLLGETDEWAVTIFGLEPLYSSEPERFEAYNISASDLLRMHNHGRRGDPTQRFAPAPFDRAYHFVQHVGLRRFLARFARRLPTHH
jgi:hypothetical protein